MKNLLTKIALTFFIIVGLIINSCKEDFPETPIGETNMPELILKVELVSYTYAKTNVSLNYLPIFNSNEYGICWDTAQQPTIEKPKVTITEISKPYFKNTAASLLPNTVYYLRAFFKTGDAVIYSNQTNITTLSAKPIVIESAVATFTAKSATITSNVTAPSGFEIHKRGVCYSINESPNLSDSYTIDDKGNGTFTSEITKLEKDKKYYVCTYATNNQGTTYGQETTLTTLNGKPQLTTTEIIDITTTTATSGGNITTNGGDELTVRGICYSTSQNPTIANNKTYNDKGIGEFTSYITNLIVNTTYYVRAYATNSMGTEYGNEQTFTTGYPPAADFTADKTDIAISEIVSFTDQSTNNPTSWAWIFGDGYNSTQQNSTHTYTTKGTYTVTLTASSIYGDDTETKTKYITVGVAPVTAFSANKTSININETVTFTDQSSNSPTSWVWNFGDGSTSTLQNPTHAYTTKGTYNVTLIATNNYGYDTETKTNYIAVGAAPTATFTANKTDVPINETITFTDQSTNYPTNWTWNFGDGSTSTLQNPTHAYTTKGTYNVTLTATNSFGNDIETKINYITVGTVPTADFTANKADVSVNETVTFTDQSTNTPTNWVWNFGDGDTSTQQNPTHTYAVEGKYTVILTATNSYGNNVKTKSDYITVSSALVANFIVDKTDIANGETVTFTDQSSNTPTSWSWDFGDGGTSTLQNPTHIYTTEGTYTVSLIATNSYGNDTETKTDYITVGSTPATEFVANKTNVSINETVTFTDQSTNTPTSWAWNFGDGVTSTLQNSTHTYTTEGVYTVILTATNSYGNNVKTKSDYITVGAALISDFIADKTDIVTNETVTFTDKSTNAPTSWSWNFGDGGTSTLQNPTHIYTTEGTYTVSLIAINDYGNDTETKTAYITVSPALIPLINEVIDTDIWDGDGGGIGNEDHLISVGEEIDLEVEIKNNGTGTAYNIVGKLTFYDPNDGSVCNITDSEESITSLAVGQTIEFDDFDFDVNGMPTDNYLNFKLTVTYDDEYGNAYTKSIFGGDLDLKVYYFYSNNPTADSYTASTATSLNTGTQSLLGIKSETSEIFYTFIKYSLSSIPSNSTIISAKLKLYIYSKDAINPYTINLYEPLEDWNESTITWDNKPSWGSGLEYTYSFSTGYNTWIDFDIKPFATYWLSNSNYGLMFRSPITTDIIFLNSRNASSNRPILEIVYE